MFDSGIMAQTVHEQFRVATIPCPGYALGQQVIANALPSMIAVNYESKFHLCCGHFSCVQGAQPTIRVGGHQESMLIWFGFYA
jgi:hypothetical protein